MKINYIIASWNGARVKRVKNINYYEQVLKNHLKILSGTLNSITQVTIMRPFSGIKNSYYDIEPHDKIKIIDCENRYQSYGQWLKASTLFLNDFDYFLFIEDDYVPATNNFDLKLIEIYSEGCYLCSKLNSDPLQVPLHCSISNGIISTKTLKKVLDNIDYDAWFKSYANKNRRLIERGGNYQIAFSRYLLENGISLKDYSNFYMVDFYYGNKLKDFTSPNVVHNEKIFTPIQSIEVPK